VRIAPEAIANVVGVAATTATGAPLVGAVVTNALVAILEDQSEALGELETDVKALVEGPYNTGMDWLREAALPHRSAQDQQEFVARARDRFMDALGQERDPFRKALIQHQLGNCWTLLGSNEDARIWFQRTHDSLIESAGNLKLNAKRLRFHKMVPPISKLILDLHQLKVQAPELSLDFGGDTEYAAHDLYFVTYAPLREGASTEEANFFRAWSLKRYVKSLKDPPGFGKQLDS
jgi:hypothetical protein